MNNRVHRVCPICSRDNADRDTIHSKDDWRVKRCDVCEFVYLENAPVYDSMVEEFSWERTSEKEKQDRKLKEPIKQRISSIIKYIRRKYLKRNKLFALINRYVDSGNVLDIGCSTGGILSRLDARYIPYGVEISRYLAARGNEVIQPKGGHIVNSDALSGLSEFDDDYFEGIIMSAFLEHEIEPRGLLEECFRVLRKGGKAIIKVPNYASINRRLRGEDWCGFRFPDHVNYFTPDSLNTLCKDVGFNVLKFDFSDRHPFSDNMWMVIKK